MGIHYITFSALLYDSARVQMFPLKVTCSKLNPQLDGAGRQSLRKGTKSQRLLFFFPVTITEYPGKNSLGEKGVIWLILPGYILPLWGSWDRSSWSRPQSRSRKNECVHASSLIAAFPLLHSSDSADEVMLLTLWRGPHPTLINPVKKNTKKCPQASLFLVIPHWDSFPR